jgi:hypothetical protein
MYFTYDYKQSAIVQYNSMVLEVSEFMDDIHLHSLLFFKCLSFICGFFCYVYNAVGDVPNEGIKSSDFWDTKLAYFYQFN